MKILPMGVSSMRTDGRIDEKTDMTNVMVSCRNFANAPKKDCVPVPS